MQYMATKTNNGDLELVNFLTSTLREISIGAIVGSYVTYFYQFSQILLDLAYEAQSSIFWAQFDPQKPHNDWLPDIPNTNPSITDPTSHNPMSVSRSSPTTLTQRSDLRDMSFAEMTNVLSLPDLAIDQSSGADGPKDLLHDLNAVVETWGLSTPTKFPVLNEFLATHSAKTDGRESNAWDNFNS
jgi:hypothetical protein